MQFHLTIILWQVPAPMYHVSILLLVEHPEHLLTPATNRLNLIDAGLTLTLNMS